MSADMVNHPPHYGSHPSSIECIEITELCSFTLGNAIKYVWRAWDKGRIVEDLDKARWYLRRNVANGCASAPPFKAQRLLVTAVTTDWLVARAELLNLISIGQLNAAIDLLTELIGDDEANR